MLFLELSTPATNPTTHKIHFDMLLRIFAFLTEKGKSIAEKNDLPDLYSFLMSTDVTFSKVIRRVSILSFSNCIAHFNIDKISEFLRRYQVKVLIGNIPKNIRASSLNKACKLMADITAKDYQEGGSFNFLTLDIGRHYIDHCADYFEKNFALASSLNQTVKIIETQVKTDNKQKDVKPTMVEVRKVLLDHVTLASRSHDQDGYVKYPKKLKNLMLQTIITFKKHFKENSVLSYLFKLETIELLASKLNLPQRFDTLEFIRSLLFCRYYPEKLPKSRSQICKEFSSSCESTGVDLKVFDNYCNELANDLSFEYISADDLWNGNGDKKDETMFYSNYLTKVESAGLCLFTAQTGWRASEYGFPLDAIKITKNKDILDGTYVPFRFQVNWTVRKTSKNTKLDREISLSSFMMGWLISRITCVAKTEPCLYVTKNKVISAFASDNFVKPRISKLWISFVWSYSLFNELEEFDSLLEIAVLSNEQRIKFEYLFSKFPKDYKTEELRRVMGKVRAGLPRLLAINYANLDTHDPKASTSERIFMYKAGTLEPSHKEMFDKFLSKKTKQIINDKEINSAKDVREDLVKLVFKEMTEGVQYPTPHSFRHMWAEAVLKRYRGDVGKFIRANFKHLDEKFFMRYLRRKDVRTIYNLTKRTVINSIVSQHLLAVEDQYKDLAGKFDVFITRLGKLVKVMSLDDIASEAENFAESNIVDIKTNSWCTCILRKSAVNQAKCAVNGVPQRQNASPRLCLGCTNSEISAGNFLGIMAAIKGSIKVCRNERLPAIFKKAAALEVKLALTTLIELKKNSGRIQYDSAIKFLKLVLSNV